MDNAVLADDAFWCIFPVDVTCYQKILHSHEERPSESRRLGCSGPEKRSLVKGPQKKSNAPRSNKKMTNIDAILWQLRAKTEEITVERK